MGLQLFQCLARQGTGEGASARVAPFCFPAPVPQVRACHFCLLEDPAVGCISGSEKCTISTSSLCMVITIHYGEYSSKQGLLLRQSPAWFPVANEGLPGSEV